MKRMMTVMIAVLLALPTMAGAGKGSGNGEPGNGGSGDKDRNRNRCSLMQELRELPLQHLGAGEKSDLLFLVEEEKLARDVYLSLYELWELQLFRQIAGMEKSHMVWARALVDRYELQDPVGDNGVGVFTDGGLQSLYTSLTAMGAESVESALLVGAAIEDMDIGDLQQALERSDNEDLDLLYQNLLKGSRNHLRAFSRALDSHGVIFEPVSLSPEEYLAIVESRPEGGVLDADGDRLCGGGPPG